MPWAKLENAFFNLFLSEFPDSDTVAKRRGQGETQTPPKRPDNRK